MCSNPGLQEEVRLSLWFFQLKQMKELEQEKDSLLAGLDVLERAREWYQTQIHNITETQRHVGQSRHSTVRSAVSYHWFNMTLSRASRHYCAQEIETSHLKLQFRKSSNGRIYWLIDSSCLRESSWLKLRTLLRLFTARNQPKLWKKCYYFLSWYFSVF